VKVHYDEGIANHIGPEPCGRGREDTFEASVGVRTGRPLSRERTTKSWMQTPSSERKAKRTSAPSRAPIRSSVVVETGMCVSSLYLGNRETSGPAGRLRRRAGPRWEGEEP
jgi:hypothetical protein